ncbi:MAG TPA: bacteriohopanetetrol glucosamine biosynthesis glycosyltransferase HpnI [Terriglobia bacterium]
MWNTVRWLVLAGAAAPLAYYAAAIACALVYFSKPNPEAPGFGPPVSVLKPMRGLNRETYRNLASFCRQQYSRYELLFGVDDARDPAVPIIHDLMAEFPDLPIRLLAGTPAVGSNNKVAKLCRLAGEASYDLLVASDGDIRVPPDYLRRVVAPFADSRVGAVTCLYRGLAESGLWSQLEDVALTSSFLPGVLVARKLGVKFALGATMGVRRQALAGIGGFESLADVAADDHELGNRIAARGSQVELARTVVETECGSRSFAEYWQHQLRWAVVTRESQPRGHLGFLFAQGLPWAMAVVALAPWRISAGFVVAYVALRLGVAFTVAVWGLGDPVVRRKGWLVLLADALGFVVWLASLGASRVVWQGSVYDVRKGILMPVNINERGAGAKPGFHP